MEKKEKIECILGKDQPEKYCTMTEIRNGNGEKSTKLVIKYGGIVRKICLFRR